MVHYNPVQEVRKPRRDNSRSRYILEEETIPLFLAVKHSQSPYLYDLVILSLCSGMRQSELTTATWSRYDEKNGLWILQKHEHKNNEKKVLPVTPLMRQVLARRKAACQWTGPNDPIFPPMKEGVYRPNRAWKTAMERAGIQDFHWHDLRHTTGSWLAMANATHSEIMQILGHRDPSQTARYTHFAVRRIRERMQELEQEHLAGALRMLGESLASSEGDGIGGRSGIV